MLPRIFTSAFWRRPERCWYGGVGASTAAHLVLIAGLALVALAAPREAGLDPIDSKWSPEEDAISAELQAPKPEPAIEARGGTAFGYTPLAVVDNQPVTALSIEITAAVSMRDLAPVFTDALADDVGPLPAGQDGHSQGNGAGDGTGDGNGFFGAQPAGRRFVFVVDSSKSMNHPHDSPAKTRFRRVKQELVRAIGLMEPTQEFFVVFFSDHSMPMPARQLQPAAHETRLHYLRWVARLNPGGQPTDPRAALKLALRLQPDVIYFLTDGSFVPAAQRELEKLRQDRVVINTFAFGDAEGERLMQTVAKNNGGTYFFIP
jgi:hypothetical protein